MKRLPDHAWPAGTPETDWRFVAWCLALVLLVVLAALGGLTWVLLAA